MLREIVVVLGVVVLMVASMTLFLGQLAETMRDRIVQAADVTGQEPREPEERYVLVHSGDSVWSIASREIEGNHAGKKVIQLRELNPWIGRNNKILPGQKVRVP